MDDWEGRIQVIVIVGFFLFVIFFTFFRSTAIADKTSIDYKDGYAAGLLTGRTEAYQLLKKYSSIQHAENYFCILATHGIKKGEE